MFRARSHCQNVQVLNCDYRRAQYLDIGKQDDAIPFRDLKVSTRDNRIWLVLAYDRKAETKM
jgi:hypothetical protein